MRVFLQLLREFWLPLSLGVIWTAYNVFDRPQLDWDTRRVLNVLGPAFFFFSWLVAQWYRVAKQQRVENELDRIQARVKAIHEPLLPCAIFMTFRMRVPEAEIERLFAGEFGYRAFGETISEAPFPPGLTHGHATFRLFLGPDRWVDYTDGRLESAAVLQPNQPGYNAVHLPIKHTVASIGSERLKAAVAADESLFELPSLIAEIYLRGRPASINVRPSLVLKRGMMTSREVIGVSALDDELVIDGVLMPLTPSSDEELSLTSSDLKNAFVRFRFEFVHFEAVTNRPVPWPSLCNLQLWMGESRRQVVTFSTDDLKSQITRNSMEPSMGGDAKCVEVLFEHQFTPQSFSEHMLRLA